VSRLEREPALPDPRRPRQRHEPVLAQELDNLRELVLAIDEQRRGRPQVAATRCGRHCSDRRILREDRLLQSPQLRARLQPQLVCKHPPRLVEGLQRIRLAAAAVQRQHQLPP
jgi:hypothetical protein